MVNIPIKYHQKGRHCVDSKACTKQNENPLYTLGSKFISHIVQLTQ